MRLILLIPLFLILNSELRAQDIHFSQYYNSPLTLNPARTGNFSGDYRAGLNYRNQWSAFVPFAWYSGFAEMKMEGELLGNDGLSFGLMFFGDKTGTAQIGTQTIGPTLGYQKKLDEAGKHTISIGIGITYVQKSMNKEGLKFPNQYKGTEFDIDLFSGESFTSNPFSYIDFQAGVLHNFIFNEKLSLSTGISVFHLTKPIESFWEQENNRLNRRLSFSTGARYILNEKVQILPGILYMGQAKDSDVMLGSNVLYNLKSKNTAVRFGGWYRMSDSFVLFTGLDYNEYQFGFSYDATLSSLNNANKSIGAFEFSLIYIYGKGAKLPTRTTMPCKRLIEKPLY
ncbi:MAG: PorP/SprF family type IX secretion system membrane protein [Bacteroidia bacterium]|nr:PorP/SprF family type IX secretion system membrane protein [Bacteroidia bacterium]